MKVQNTNNYTSQGSGKTMENLGTSITKSLDSKV